MEQPAGLEKTTPPRTFVERRQRKVDPLSRALRYIALLIYPLLIINFFIFMGVASEDQKMVETVKQVGQVSAQRVSSWVHLNAFLPIMIAGLLIGIVGIVIDSRRSRRRSDYSRKNQLGFIILSVIGLVLYLIFR